MLKLRRSLNISWPNFSKKEMALSPVYTEDNELIQAIEEERDTLEQSWDLDASVNGEDLIDFWNDAKKELGRLATKK